MKSRRFSLVLVLTFTFLLFTACGKAVTSTQAGSAVQPAAIATPDWQSLPETLPSPMKGYELYSWMAGSTRVYTLVTGTNRAKSFEEITVVENSVSGEYLKITVASLEDLKQLLARLPEGEEVFWGGINLEGEVSEGILYFSYPEDKEMEEIMRFAQETGITLHTLKEGGEP